MCDIPNKIKIQDLVNKLIMKLHLSNDLPKKIVPFINPKTEKTNLPSYFPRMKTVKRTDVTDL